MKYIIKDKEVDIIFDGQYYVGTYNSIEIKRLYKIDVINRIAKLITNQ